MIKKNLISKLTRLSFTHRRFFGIIILIFVAAAPFIIRGIRFETTSSRDSLPNDPVSQLYRENLRRFGDSETLLIYLDYSQTSLEVINSFTDILKQELISWPDIIYVEASPFDFKDIPKAARMMRTVLLNSDQELRQRFSSKFNESEMRRELLKTRRRLITISDPSLREIVVKDVLNLRDILLPFYETRMGNFKFSYLNGYFDSLDEKGRLIFVQPAGFSEDADFCAEFINRINETIIRVKTQIPDAETIQHELTGKYAVIGESIQILKRDMKFITLAATGLIILLLSLAFRNIRAVVICFFPLFISMLAVLVFAYIAFNPLNFMAMGFVAIILGLGVDVSLHCTARFFQVRENSPSHEDAVKHVLNEAGPPVVIGLCTTAVVFFCLIFADYKALFQFGFLTSVGLLITLVLSLALFPVAIAFFGPRQGNNTREIRFRRLPNSLISFPLNKPYLAVGTALMLMLFSVWFLRKFSFEMDFFTAFPEKLKTLETAQKVSSQFGSALFMNSQITMEAENFEDAMAAQKILDEKMIEYIQDNKIDGFQSSSLFLPYSMDEFDIVGFQKIKTVIKDNRDHFFGLLDELKFREREEYKTYYEIIETAVDINDEEMTNGLSDPKRRKHFPQLNKFLVEEKGKIYLQTYVWPKFDHEDKLPSDEHIFDDLISLSSQIDTKLHVTSTFQVFSRIGETVRNDFFKISFISLAAVLFLMIIFFRNIPSVFLSLLPLIGAVPFTLAFVVLAKISFSPFQIGITAMLIGIGIDDAVHLLTRARLGDAKSIREVFPEIAPVITLTTISTLIGFGALTFSRNQSVLSMGFVIAMGVFSCLVFTFLLVPSVLRILERKK